MKSLFSTFVPALVLSFVTTSAALAGDGLATLDCKSPSGKTTVHATMTDGGEIVFQYTLRNADDKGSTQYGYLNYMARLNTGDGSDAAVQSQFPGIKSAAIVHTSAKSAENFTVVTIDSKGDDEQPIALSSIDGTVRVSGPRNDRGTTFRAILSGRDPRVSPSYKWLEGVKMTCSMKYSI